MPTFARRTTEPAALDDCPGQEGVAGINREPRGARGENGQAERAQRMKLSERFGLGRWRGWWREAPRSARRASGIERARRGLVVKSEEVCWHLKRARRGLVVKSEE